MYSRSDFSPPPPRPIYAIGMIFGTFDLLHPGHHFYIQTAGKYAQKLIIVVARDDRVLQVKGKKTTHTETTRREHLAEAYPHYEVILGDKHDIFAPIREHAPEILLFGYDQHVPHDVLHHLFPHLVYARIAPYYPEKYKTSLISDRNKHAKWS